MHEFAWDEPAIVFYRDPSDAFGHSSRTDFEGSLRNAAYFIRKNGEQGRFIWTGAVVYAGSQLGMVVAALSGESE